MRTTERRQGRAGSEGGLRAVERDFERWRRKRKRGARIPEGLWKSAVAQAHEHGVNRTAQTLHLDYYALKRRLDPDEGEPGTYERRAAVAEFVEIELSDQAKQADCVVELEVQGRKLRVELAGVSVRDLAQLTRSLMNGVD